MKKEIAFSKPPVKRKMTRWRSSWGSDVQGGLGLGLPALL